MQKTVPNNHVANTTIYLFDSIISHENVHIARLHAAIMVAIENARKSANKTLNIYVDCPDTVIDERFQRTLNELYQAAQSGVNLSIHDASNTESMYSRILQSIVEVAQMPQPVNSPFRKYMKQH